jgi:hypothetical protein
LFLGTYPAPSASTKPTQLISEQVSHHPPITAYHINTPYNITLTGYNGADLSFKSSYIVVRQTGHAQLTITLPDNTKETFYITLPDLKIQGLQSFVPYVELDRTTYIMSSTGYLGTIDYASKGWLSGQKNSFTAILAKGQDTLYKINGQWTGESTSISVLHPAQKNIPFWNAKVNHPTHIVVAPVPAQSPWESRKVWEHVASAIEKNDVETAGRYKSPIEIGQRKMRDEETRMGESWKPRFFKWVDNDVVASELRGELAGLTGHGGLGGKVGSWVFTPDEDDQKALENGELFRGA